MFYQFHFRTLPNVLPKTQPETSFASIFTPDIPPVFVPLFYQCFANSFFLHFRDFNCLKYNLFKIDFYASDTYIVSELKTPFQ